MVQDDESSYGGASLARQEALHHPTERLRLSARGEIPLLMDCRAEATRYGSGLIGTMVSDDVYFEQFAGVIEIVNADKQSPDDEFLIVCGNNNCEASNWRALLPALR